MKILITGSNGQLGSELKKASATAPEFKNIGQIFFNDVDTLDICDIEAVEDFLEKNRIDVLVNCAAYTAVDKAESDVEQCYRINSDAVKNLVLAAKKFETKLIHISTDYVFDGRAYIPYTEEVTINPQSIYGKSKAEGEAIISKLYAENSVIIRTSWLYSNFGNNFVKSMIRIGMERNAVSVVFDQIGTPTNAADLANAILHIINTNVFKSGIYHYSNEGVCSWYDFAKEIFRQNKIDCKVLPIESKDYPVPAPRPHYSVLNKSKIKNTYGLEILHWQESLNQYLKP